MTADVQVSSDIPFIGARIRSHIPHTTPYAKARFSLTVTLQAWAYTHNDRSEIGGQPSESDSDK